MAILDHSGEIPEEYLTGFEREMQETTDGKVTKSWTEYSKGYVPRGIEEIKFDELEHKSSWFKDKDKLDKHTLSGAWQTETRGLGKQREHLDKTGQLLKACQLGDKNACMLIQANTPGFNTAKAEAKQKVGMMSPYQRKGFAQGGMLDGTSRLWKMESTYPEFQKGIANRVTKDRVPTAPIEEEYMYSPTQSGYPQGYADGGSVYDTEGSMLAPEAPLNFEEDMPMNTMPMEEESELGLSPEETEVLAQAMSDYPELEDILNKVDSSVSSEFTSEGEVEGPGTGTSDSINAKLSDGEFVFTAKAVKQLGVDKLRKMMDKAEGDYDEASTKQEYQQMSDVGFAKGGFFDRPSYNRGGEHTEKPQSTAKASLGTLIKNVLFSPFALAEDKSIDPDTEEDYASERYKKYQEEHRSLFDQPERYDSTEGDAPVPSNEDIYPEDEYPNQYK